MIWILVSVWCFLGLIVGGELKWQPERDYGMATPLLELAMMVFTAVAWPLVLYWWRRQRK